MINPERRCTPGAALLRIAAAAGAALILTSAPVRGQVDLVPNRTSPGAWERFALRVANQQSAPIDEVMLTVPEAVTVLGVEAFGGWQFEFTGATDTSPQVARWTGDSLVTGEFREFALLGRVAADLRRRDLVFPVSLRRSDGTRQEWRRHPDAGVPPIVAVAGSTVVGPWGPVGLASAAVGIAIIALGLAVAARRAPR